MFFESVVSSAILFVMRAADSNGLNKLFCKAWDVLGMKLYSLETGMERRMLQKLQIVFDNSTQPLRLLLDHYRSTQTAKNSPQQELRATEGLSFYGNKTAELLY